MQSTMSQQLREHQPLARRLATEWREIVILERWARAAGATRWFFVTSQAMLERVFDLLRGGSSVSFYFAKHLHVEIDNETARQEMFDEITRHGELVLGYPQPGDTELEMLIASGPSDLTECLMHHPEGALVVWGQWPSRENDGETVISVDLVDADGILRSHPH
jgi:hypothetical protein